MAELLLAPVIEKLVENLVEKLIEKLSDVISVYLKDQFRWQKGMKKELENLRKIHPHIQSVISSYSQVEIKDPALNKWYWQLRDAIDEADDVLDEIEYRKLEKEACKNNKTGKVRSLMKWIKKKFKRALKIDSYLKRLEEALHNLNEISNNASTFRKHLKDEKQEQEKQELVVLKNRETGSLIKNNLLGRENEMEAVRKWLRNPYETQSTDTDDLYRNISVLSVVGQGGMGKTTLLQHVYNKDADLFGVKMWACVSTNFDAKTVIKNILESLNKKNLDLTSLDSLQTSLQSEVKNKRFLLVLDDIWKRGDDEDEEKWKNVFACLQYGKQGSKILISTRMDLVASMFAKIFKNDNKKLLLEGLEGKELLKLFNTHAFAKVENPDGEFKSIAEKFVEKLFGCPLAAKVIGNVLNSSVDKIFWKKVLETNIGNIKPGKPGQNDLLSILKLSYIYLPDYLQNCFSFCCIFQQDYKFDKDDLVRMWIALGFIQSSNIQGETLEEIGRRNFDFLIQRSFFDKFSFDDCQTYYKMHDLLHELAQSVSMQECSRVEDDKKLSIPATIRHLSIDTSNHEVLKEIEKFKYLRSLFLSFSVDDENVISQILKASKSLRLLVIYAPNNNYSVPETINRLIHLRYLKVVSGALKLSRCISHLYHLQFVLFDNDPANLVMDSIGWEKLRPNENCHLIIDKLFIYDPSKLLMEPVRSISYLRFLTFYSFYLVSFPSEIESWFLQHSSTLLQLKFENLQSLQSLPSLLTFSSLTYLKFVKIPLKSLPDLPSSLKVLYLYELELLESLPSSLSAISNSLETIELREIPLLKSLPDLPSSLKTLKLIELKSLESMSSSLSAIPSLKTLKLHDILLLKSLPDLPSSLKILKIYNCESLESLPSSLSAIHSLETLKLHDIPLLKSLPDLPSSLDILILMKLENLDWQPSCLPTRLRQLYIYEVRLLELPDLPSSLQMLVLDELNSIERLPSSLSAISSLDTLQLSHIPLLKSLPDLPSSLKNLDLDRFKSLESLPSSLSAIPSLETLKVHDIRLLKSLPDLPYSLKKLDLSGFKSLESLPSSLSAISSLETLQVYGIRLLKSLPDLPSSLKELMLQDLESLESLPSSLSAISSLQTIDLYGIPLLKSLPDLPSSLKYLKLRHFVSLQCLPSSLSAISSLETLELFDIPLLKSLPDLPSSLKKLELNYFKSLQCLPSSLSAISSLETLELKDIPLLKSLPDLPSSLETLDLRNLENLDCLPSCLPTRLRGLTIHLVPRLLKLPDLSSSLQVLYIERCDPQLMERYPNFRRQRQREANE